MFNFLKKQKKDIKTKGIKEIYKKIYILFNYIFIIFLQIVSIPFLFFIYLIKPIVTIRFGEINPDLFGVLAEMPALYCCEREANKNTKKRSTIDIFYLTYRSHNNIYNHISNKYLVKMWKRTMRFFPGLIIQPLSRTNNFFARYISYLKVHDVWDAILDNKNSRETSYYHLHNRNIIQEFSPQLKFTQEEEKMGEDILLKFGLPKGSKFICLAVRDKGYEMKNTPFRASGHNDYRNMDVNNFMLAAEELTKRGYWVFRMGKDLNTKINTSNPKIIDYANSNMRSEFMDIFLGAKCTFCLSSSQGYECIPYIFNKPIACMIAPLIEMSSYSSNYFVLIRDHFSVKNQKKLSLSEIFETNSAFVHHSSLFNKHGVVLKDNLPEEIRDLSMEVLDRCEGRWLETDENKELQKKFWKIFYQNINYKKDDQEAIKLMTHTHIENMHIHSNCNISSKFLMQNKSFLEAENINYYLIKSSDEEKNSLKYKSGLKKAWAILNLKQKKKAIFIFFLMLVATVVETLSIGVLVPLLSIILKGEVNLGFVSSWFNFQIPSGNNLIYAGLLSVILVFVMKVIFLLYNHWHQSKFLETIWVELSDKLFKDYLRKDYLFFVKKNTSELIRNIRGEIPSFIEYLTKYILLLGETIISLGICGLLLFIDASTTIIILSILALFTFLIHMFTTHKISSMGQERILHEGDYERHLAQGLTAAKDIKILNREENLIHQFLYRLKEISQIALFVRFLGGVPKYTYELIIVAIFSVIIIYMLSINRDIESIIQYLAIFAVASFRIIPGAARIFTAYQQIKFRQPTVDHMINELSYEKENINKKIVKKDNDNDEKINFEKSINISNVSFAYPIKRRNFSLSKISLEIYKGQFIGIVGKTGSGKSTFINILTGLLEPMSGKIESDGKNIFSNCVNWQKKIGYVPQTLYLTDDKIKNNIAFGLLEKDIDENSINKAIEKANLNEFIESLPDGINTIVGEKGIQISGGQQQRIAIARALYNDPEILIMDEATSSLDIFTEKKIMDSIYNLKGKKTLIVITHRLSTIENCDKIFFLEEGKIIKQGLPKEVLKKKY